MKTKNRNVVYTVVIGDQSSLPIQNITNKNNIDFICLTDNPNLKSEEWQIRQITNTHLGNSRESRKPKILAHDFLANYDYSLYIDSNVRLKIDPSEIFDKYCSKGLLFAALEHPWRNCIYEEAKEVILNSYDHDQRVLEQIDLYRSKGYPQENGLIAGGFLIRQHNHPKVIELMQLWFNHVLTYSKRDQISFNYCCWLLNFNYKSLALDPTNNHIFDWPVIEQPRVPKDFDSQEYYWLNPDVKQAGVSATWHYQEYGHNEKRRYKYLKPLRINKLANFYKTDKGDNYYNRHFYSRVYEHYLSYLLGHKHTLVEIGLLRHDVQWASDSKVFDDAPSISLWKDYFPEADIIGFDIADFSGFSKKGCQIIKGDQGNRDDLKKIFDNLDTQKPVKTIIDDASHASHHQQISLGYLFQKLDHGGLYFIEDLHYQPASLEKDTIKTKDLLMNYKNTNKISSEFISKDEASYLESNIEFVEFYDSMDYMSADLSQDAIAVIKKRT